MPHMCGRQVDVGSAIANRVHRDSNGVADAGTDGTADIDADGDPNSCSKYFPNQYPDLSVRAGYISPTHWLRDVLRWYVQ